MNMFDDNDSDTLDTIQEFSGEETVAGDNRSDLIEDL